MQLPCLAEWPDRDFLPDICTRWQGPRAVREAVFPAEPWGTPQAVLLPTSPQATGGGQEFITVRVPRGCGLAGEGPRGARAWAGNIIPPLASQQGCRHGQAPGPFRPQLVGTGRAEGGP